jgi:cobalt transporter subunit CbtA
VLKTLILSAAAAGVAAGLLTAALQHVTTTPVILEAERYENGAAAVAPSMSNEPEFTVVGTHDGHVHDAAAWTPADGLERTFYSALTTTLMGVGFSLALLGAMALTETRIDGRTGLAFGVAGFAALALAPALGLPPEMPGSAAAGLAERQIWWFATATATAAGLAALLLARNRLLQVAGIGLIALPHLVGAPQPEAFASTAPAELAGHFAAASLVVTAVFWAVLGFASGAFYERLARSA